MTAHAISSPEELLLDATQYMHVGIAVVSAAGPILAANQALLDMLCLSAQDFLNKEALGENWDIVGVDDRPLSAQERGVARAIRSRHPVRGVVMGVKCPSREERVWLLQHVVPILAPDGSIDRLVSTVTDVSQQIRAEREAKRMAERLSAALDALRASEIRYRTLVEMSPDHIVVLDRDGIVVLANQRAAELQGCDDQEALTGRSVFDLLVPEDRDRARDDFRRALGTRRVMQREYTLLRPDGMTVPVEVRGTVLRDDGAHAVGLIGVATDITERKRAERTLRYQALHDSLTELPNRRFLLERLNAAISLAHDERTSAAILVLDLDRFKAVNDAHGHRLGDVVLRQLADRLRDALRRHDTVARLGGDEFAIILPDTEMLGALSTAAKILRAVEDPWEVEGHAVHLGGSIGIALCPEHGTDGPALLHAADLAMYVAKRGELGYQIYSPDMGEPSRQEVLAAGELRRALEERQLLLHYQPEVDLRSNTVTSVEALIRWDQPERGLRKPAEFLPAAESSGLIQPITRWVLQQALTQCKAWQDAGIRLRVSINLSEHSLRDEHLTHVIERQLELSGLDPSSLQIEISEAALIRDADSATHLLARLRDLGVRISIDNVGNSRASLAQLRRTPASEIKIDRRFTRNVLQSPEDALAVRSVIDLAHHLDLEVVAQGAEDQQVVDALSGMGCDAVQGFHLGVPLPPRDLTAWLAAREGKTPPDPYQASA